MTDNIHNYIDIGNHNNQSNNHHVNQLPLLTDWEIEQAEYSDYSKYQLLIDTCKVCSIQQCWVHEYYPIPPISRR